MVIRRKRWISTFINLAHACFQSVRFSFPFFLGKHYGHTQEKMVVKTQPNSANIFLKLQRAITIMMP